MSSNRRGRKGLQTSAIETPGEDEIQWGRRPRKPGAIESFLWFAAGANRDALASCPRSDGIKYQGLGGVILATATMAAISMHFALTMVFGFDEGRYYVVALSLLWAAIIFNLDRLIVSGLDVLGTSFSKRLVRSIPRLLVAIMLSLVIAEPLVLRVLRPEIDAELAKRAYDHAKEIANKKMKVALEVQDDKLATVAQEIADAESDCARFKSKIDELNTKLNLELSGQGTSKLRGRGWVAKALERQLHEEEQELANGRERVQVLKEERATIKKGRDKLKLQRSPELIQAELPEIRKNQALLEHLDVAHDIGGVVLWALRILFLLVEVAPVLTKITMPVGVYDYIVENDKRYQLGLVGIAYRTYGGESAGAGGSIPPGGAPSGEGSGGKVSYANASEDREHSSERVRVGEEFLRPQHALRNELDRLEVQSELSHSVLKRYSDVAKAEIHEFPERFIVHPRDGEK